MIFCIFIFILISETAQQSYIPASFAQSLVSCRLNFGNNVREVYPDYHIVTGEQFISQFDHSSCSVTSSQSHTSSSCLDATCSDQATGVVQKNSTTFYYCYTDNKSPKPMTATVLPNGTYSYSSGGVKDVCLYDSNKHSFVTMNEADQLLYIATDSEYDDQSGLHYYSLKDQKTRSMSPWEVQGLVEDVLGIFTRGDFLYTVYIDNNNGSKITRSCKNDQSGDGSDLLTFTFTKLQCLDNIGGEEVLMDRVLGLEYSPSQDKLFVLSTRSPVSSSSVALCVFDVAQDIDLVFDTSQYYTQDESGKKIKTSQKKIDCSSTRYPVVSECVDAANTIIIAVHARSTDVFAFSLHEVNGNLLFFLINSNSLRVYNYESTTKKGQFITEVVLWDEPTTVAISEGLIFLTFEKSLVVMPTYWCSYYGQDPVSCLGSMHPSCSYSKRQSKCINTDKCSHADECVQDLKGGAFSSLFPSGYTFTARGTDCLNDMIYTDVTYTYFANSTFITHTSFRECTMHPATTSPSKSASRALSTREFTLLAVMIVTGAGFLLLLIVLFVLKGKPRLCWSDPGKSSLSVIVKKNIVTAVNSDSAVKPVDICKTLDMRGTPCSSTVKYNTSEDKKAIVDPGTPSSPDGEKCLTDPFSNMVFPQPSEDKAEKQHHDVYRNPSAGAIELA